MNSNTTEEQIKNKLETLDTLQAGIVFGREDAWDKLQARLDAKPVRKPFPVFRMAAAAALLLAVITIAIMYLQPKQNSTTLNAIATLPNQDINRSDVMVSSVYTEPAEVPNLDSTHSDVMVRPSNHDISIGQDHKSIVDGYRITKFVSSAPAKPLHKQTLTPAPLPEPQPIAQAPQPTPDAVPPPAPKPAMKVVHINELDKEEAPAYEIADKDIPHPHVMFKMKVIHINDLMKPISQDEYLREMQNNTAVRIPFFHRPGYDRPANDQPKSFFRINLSN